MDADLDRADEQVVPSGTAAHPERRERNWHLADRRQGERRITPGDSPALDAVNDPARMAALRATGLIEVERHTGLEQLAELAARTLNTPVAQVNLVTPYAQVPLAASVVGDTHANRWKEAVSLDASFCKHVVASSAPLVVNDARDDPLVRDNEATRHSGVVSYAAAPLFAPDGQPLGAVCVIGFEPREWTGEEVETLNRFAALASSEIALHATAKQALTAADRALETRARMVEAERAQLLAVIQQMPLGIAIAEAPSGKLLLHNAVAVQLLGHEMGHVQHSGGKRTHGALHEDGTPYQAHEYPLARAAMRGETLSQQVMHYRRGDGTVTILSVSAAPVRNSDNVVVAAVSTFEDISERKAVEAALRASEARLQAALQEAEQARGEAEGANRAKSDFLAVMSHELRTPLNAIGGYAELLELGIRGAVTPQQREDLRRIQHSQQHLLGLINEVLNYAKIETGTVHYELTLVHVCDALSAAEGLVAPQARAKELSLHVGECHSDLVVYADSDKMRQILVNLLSNAVKFTATGGELELTCEEDDRHVHLHVRDTGIGIPADKLEEIFEPFVQVRADLTRTAEGTGLGLAISRDLARGMGGDITAASTPGGGSTFTLTLPRS